MENEHRSSKLPESKYGIASVVCFLVVISLVAFILEVKTGGTSPSLLNELLGWIIIGVFLLGVVLSILGLLQQGRNKRFATIACFLGIALFVAFLIAIILAISALKNIA